MSLVRKARSLGSRRLLHLFLPRRVDQFLYRADAVCEPVQLPRDYVLTHHDARTAAGIPRIDARLTDGKECYLVRNGGVPAHWSWLSFDTVLPSQFGFDAAPVVGDCFTDERFRGQGIYRKVLRHIRWDVGRRGVAEQLYVLVSPANTASVRGIEGAGFARLARLRAIRWLGLSFLKRKSFD